MKLLSDYIFDNHFRYEAHKMVYTYSETEEPIQIGGFLGAALLCVHLINSEQGEQREIPLDLEQKPEGIFIRYDQEVIADDWGYLPAEIDQLNDAYIQLSVSEKDLSDLCPNLRQLSIAIELMIAYMQRLVKQRFGEHIWEAEPWKAPFAQWLFDAGYTETLRQRLLNIDWTDPVAVNALAEVPYNTEEPTFFFEGEDAADIRARYWDWLWNTAQQGAAVFPDSNVVMAENKALILQKETNYDDIKPKMKDFQQEQINLFRSWMNQWTGFVESQIEPPVSTGKKDIRQELFLDNISPIPPEHNYVKVREYIIERCMYDKEFEKYFKAHKRTDFCNQLSLLFDWYVDPNALGKRMKKKYKK